MKLRHALPYIMMIVAAAIIMVAYQMWKVTMIDIEPPTITVSDEILEVSITSDTDALIQGIKATDNKDGDVTGSIVVEKIGYINDNNEVLVTYAAFDQSGNVAKLRRTVRYFDYESPRFSLDQPLLFLYGRDVDIESNVHVLDMVDGDISHKIKPTLVSQVPVSSEGIHQMLFRITNSLGDTVELQMPVEIYPTGKYNANLSLTDYLVYIPKGSAFDPYDYLEEFSSEFDTISLRGNIPTEIHTVISGQVNTNVSGVYPITYTVTYEKELTSFTALSKLIVIVEG